MNRDPRIKTIAEALKGLPGPETEEERAWGRYQDGTLTDADLDVLGFNDIEESSVWKLISLSKPFKAVRSVGYSVPERTKVPDVLGLLLSYGPDETPDQYLVDRIRGWLEPRPTENDDEIATHNLVVAARRAMGADDGGPLRQAIADGKWDPPVGRSAPHPGYVFCPLDCTGERIDAQVCFCCNPFREFAHRADVPDTFIPWKPDPAKVESQVVV